MSWAARAEDDRLVVERGRDVEVRIRVESADNVQMRRVGNKVYITITEEEDDGTLPKRA